MAFGLSGGFSKTKSKTTTDVNKTETGTEATTQNKTSTGTTTNTGSTTGSGTQVGSQTGATTGSTTGSQTQTGTTSQFSAGAMSALEQAAGDLLGGIGGQTDKLTYDSNFDVGSFVEAGVNGARNRIESDRDTGINSMYDQFGGRDDQNSMVALLANRARGDSEAAIGDVRAKLEAQGRGIARDDFMANLQGNAQNQNYLATVLGALKGGTQTTTGQVLTAEQQAATSQQNTNNATTTNENTQSTQTQQLAELLAGLVNSTSTMVGHEKTKSKGSTIGGGASLSF
jgi:hypothetical protein